MSEREGLQPRGGPKARGPQVWAPSNRSPGAMGLVRLTKASRATKASWDQLGLMGANGPTAPHEASSAPRSSWNHGPNGRFVCCHPHVTSVRGRSTCDPFHGERPDRRRRPPRASRFDRRQELSLIIEATVAAAPAGGSMTGESDRSLE